MIYTVFASAVFLLCPHIISVNRGMPVFYYVFSSLIQEIQAYFHRAWFALFFVVRCHIMFKGLSILHLFHYVFSSLTLLWLAGNSGLLLLLSCLFAFDYTRGSRDLTSDFIMNLLWLSSEQSTKGGFFFKID